MADTSNDPHPPASRARSRLGWTILSIVSFVGLLTVGILAATRSSEPTAPTKPTTMPAASAEPVTDPQTLAFQNRLDQSLQTMLDSVLGPGNSVVTTTATLDFGQVDRAASDAVASKHADSTDGVLGPDNIQVPDDAPAATGQETDANEVRRRAPGVVKRLIIVVQMNVAAAGNADPVSVQRLVSAAAGINPERGDYVMVRS